MIEASHEVIGCNTNIRFHAERGDFSVNDATRAKIFINGSRCHNYFKNSFAMFSSAIL